MESRAEVYVTWHQRQLTNQQYVPLDFYITHQMRISFGLFDPPVSLKEGGALP